MALQASVVRGAVAPAAPSARYFVGCSGVRLAPAGAKAAKAKRSADPEKPKRPTVPYFRYLQHYRQQHPGVKPTEAAKPAAVEWKALSALEKRPFEEPFQTELAVYKQKMQEYVASGKHDAWKRDPAKPKRPITAFLRFTADMRAKHSEKKLTEVTKLAGQEWKNMSLVAKQPYESAYAEERKTFSEAQEKYKASGSEEAWKEKVGIKSKADAKEKAKEATLKKKEAANIKKAAEIDKKKKVAAKKKATADAKKPKAAEVVQKKRVAAAKNKEAAAQKKTTATAVAATKKAASAGKEAAAKKEATGATSKA